MRAPVWRRRKAKINMTEKLAEAISFPKPAIDLANDNPALVTERSTGGNEKSDQLLAWLVISFPMLVSSTLRLATHWISYWLDW